MSDTDTQRQELDDWRDLVTSGGWKRLLEAYDQQWGDASLIKTLESLNAQGGDVSSESRKLLDLRVAMRQFLHYPAQRVAQLESARANSEKEKAKPWTRPV